MRGGLGFGRGVLGCEARRRDKDTEEFDDYIDPAKAEPMEAIDPEEEEMSKFDRVVREAERVRKSQEEEYKRTKPVFMRAIGLGDQVEEDAQEEDSDGTFDLVNEAVASKKTQARSNQASAPPSVVDEELDAEEAADLEDIEDTVAVELDEDDEDEFTNFNDGAFGGLPLVQRYCAMLLFLMGSEQFVLFRLMPLLLVAAAPPSSAIMAVGKNKRISKGKKGGKKKIYARPSF